MELALEGALVEELRSMMEEAAEQVEKRAEDCTWAAVAPKLVTTILTEDSHLYFQITYVSDGTWKKSPSRPNSTTLDHQVELEVQSPLHCIVLG